MELLEFVKAAHGSQTRRGGEELYFNHPMRVAEAMKASGFDGDFVSVALLHDVVEDTDKGFEDCDVFMVSDEGKEALRLVTKLDGETGRQQIERIKCSGNRIALWVKYFDAKDNAIMSEAGIKFTREILGRDPFKGMERYLNMAKELLAEIQQRGY